MLAGKLPSDKFNQIKDTFKTSVRMLGLVWNIDKWLFLASAVSNLIPGIIPFVNIYIYKLIIDLVVAIASGQPFDPAKFYPLIGIRIFTYFIQDAAFSTQGYIEKILWTKVPIYLNQVYFKKISTLDVYYFESDKFHDLLEKARQGYDFRPQQMVGALFYALQSTVQFLIAFVALARLNWFFIILISLVAIPEFITSALNSKLSWGIWGENSPYRKRYDYLTRLLQGPREFKEVKMFSLAKRFLGEVKDIQEKFYVDNKKISKRGYGADLIYSILSSLVFIGIEIYVVFQAFAKKVTVGDISFYTGVVSNYQNGLAGVLRNVNKIFETSLYVKSLFELLDLEPILKISDNPMKLLYKKPPVIEFRNVDFTYPETNKKILHNFSLTIQAGEKVALVGENGAGKSTVIKLLTRFYDVDAGEILIDGVNVKDLDLDNWYLHLGVLFQDFNRYEHTTAENIYFGKVHEDMDLKKVVEAAISAGAHSFIKTLDKGYCNRKFQF